MMFYGWKIVGVSIVGLALGYSAITVISFGVFMEPLVQQFGWSRSQISLALTSALYTSVFAAPAIGFLIDRYGIRKPLIISTALFGLTVCSMYWLSAKLWHFYLMYALLALLGCGTAPVTYSKALVQWFQRKRGLALGVGLAGVGIGAGLIPPLTQTINSEFGWREAYLSLGLLVLLVSLPTTLFFFKNDPKEINQGPDGDPVKNKAGTTANNNGELNEPAGLTMREALRSRYYWLLAVIFFILGLTLTGVIVHLIPMLTDRGLSAAKATSIASTMGLTLILGRILAGYLMDRYFAPYVTIAFLIAPVIGLGLLAVGASGFWAVLSAVFFGLAIGAEFDVMAFFISRYIGARSFGRVYGQIFAIFQLGAGFGPLIMASYFDNTGEYTIALWILAGLTLTACILFGFFGAYPIPASSSHNEHKTKPRHSKNTGSALRLNDGVAS